MWCGLSYNKRKKLLATGADFTLRPVLEVAAKVKSFEVWASKEGRSRTRWGGREYQVVVEHMVLPDWLTFTSGSVIENCLSKEMMNLGSGNLVETVEELERVDDRTWIQVTRFRGLGYVQPPREECLVYHRPHSTCFVAFTPPAERVAVDMATHVLISGVDVMYRSTGERYCRYVQISTNPRNSSYFELVGDHLLDLIQ